MMEKPATVLIVNWQDPANPLSGGAEVHLHEVAKRMVRDGIRCILYASSFSGAEPHDFLEGVEIFRKGARWNFNFVVWLSIGKWIKKHNADLIIDDSNKIPFCLPWLTRKPVLIRIHHLFRRSIFKEALFPAALYVYVMEYIASLSWKSSQVVAVSPSTIRDLEALGVKRVHLALNGVSHADFYAAATDEKNVHRLIYLGRLKKYKSIDTLIEVLQLLQGPYPELTLEIVGTGDDRDRLKAKARALGLTERVTFRGFVSGEEKRKLLAESVLALNSSLKEGYGLTTIEANACGTCVVATDVPGLRDSVRHNITGKLVPFQDAQKMAEAVAELLDHADQRRKMERAALAFAAEHDWEVTYRATYQAMKAAFTGGRR